jgi:hypothetical protein
MINYLKICYPNSEMLIDVNKCSTQKIQKLHRFFKKMNPKALSYILTSDTPLYSVYAED